MSRTLNNVNGYMRTLNNIGGGNGASPVDLSLLLQKQFNLNDLPNKNQARINLGLIGLLNVSSPYLRMNAPYDGTNNQNIMLDASTNPVANNLVAYDALGNIKASRLDIGTTSVTSNSISLTGNINATSLDIGKVSITTNSISLTGFINASQLIVSGVNIASNQIDVSGNIRASRLAIGAGALFSSNAIEATGDVNITGKFKVNGVDIGAPPTYDITKDKGRLGCDSGGIYISTGNGATQIERFRMNFNNGFAGIGVSNPAYNLDVNGNINFTGSLYQNGVLFTSGGTSGGSGTVDLSSYAQKTQNLADLTNASIARSNLGIDLSLYAQKSQNLADLTNATTARSNLGIDLSLYAQKSQNLADLTNITTARTNIGLIGKLTTTSSYLDIPQGFNATADKEISINASTTSQANYLVAYNNLGFITTNRLNTDIIWPLQGTSNIRIFASITSLESNQINGGGGLGASLNLNATNGGRQYIIYSTGISNLWGAENFQIYDKTNSRPILNIDGQREVSIFGNCLVATNVTIGSALSTGTSATIGSTLSVGTSATIGSTLSVGTNATIAGNLQVNGSIRVNAFVYWNLPARSYTTAIDTIEWSGPNPFDANLGLVSNTPIIFRGIDPNFISATTVTIQTAGVYSVSCSTGRYTQNSPGSGRFTVHLVRRRFGYDRILGQCSGGGQQFYEAQAGIISIAGIQLNTNDQIFARVWSISAGTMTYDSNIDCFSGVLLYRT